MEEGRLVDMNSTRCPAAALSGPQCVDLGAHGSQALCWQLLCLSGHYWVGMQAGVADLSPPPHPLAGPPGLSPQQNTCSS